MSKVTGISPKRRPLSRRGRRGGGRVGWLYLLPALVMYGVFVLQPLFLTLSYSFYEWDGVGPSTWVGLDNYRRVFDDPDLYGAILNSLKLLVFYSVIPVTIGVGVAALIHGALKGRFGTVARAVIFLPQIIPLVAAGIIWGLLLSLNGLVNRLLELVGLGGLTRAWLGDFDFALPAVGVIGIWVLLGFCTVLLQTGMAKIDESLYEAARLDGAGWFDELRAVTIPGIRREISVCITVTAIAALASFDIVYVSTGGGPGNSTAVPGIQIFSEAFLQRRIGVASALAITLTVLVLAIVLPIQRLGREAES
ncbi:MAG: carbohydrate ABC transporter permease [Acidimicrobiales bacterium]